MLNHITWWRFQEWVVPCPPEHTSSSLWTGGTGLVYKGLRAHSRGWKWPHEDSAEPPPVRSVAPGHKRELSLKPWETHSIQRDHDQEYRNTQKNHLSPDLYRMVNTRIRAASKIKLLNKASVEAFFHVLYLVQVTIWRQISQHFDWLVNQF